MQLSKQIQPSYHLVSDRPDPQDANDRIYGPGTHDGNVGILRTEYERQQREYREFLASLDALKSDIESKRQDSLREKIEELKKEFNELRGEAWEDFWIAVGESVATGIYTIECPPLAVFAAYAAIKNFKEFAENYHNSVDIEVEIQKLLDIERSLEKSRELHGSGREK